MSTIQWISIISAGCLALALLVVIWLAIRMFKEKARLIDSPRQTAWLEKIECPKCNFKQEATVIQKADNQAIRIHICRSCRYAITADEWRIVKKS